MKQPILVAGADCQEISVAAEFTEGRLDLCPFGGEALVTRERDGDQLVWVYQSIVSGLRLIDSLPN